jgi:hypothetical protein
MIRPKRPTATMIPIFLAMEDDTDDDDDDEPEMSVDAFERVILGVELEELVPYM